VSCVEKGPVFRVPITIVRPMQLPRELLRPELNFTNVLFKPNTMQRHFVLVPDEATWAGKHSLSFCFTIWCFNSAASPQVVHCLQITREPSDSSLCSDILNILLILYPKYLPC